MNTLYHQLFGVNPLADELLAMLRLTREDCGRFRDAYLSAGGARIYIYTRNGGVAKPYLTGTLDKLRQHSAYVKEYEDKGDSYLTLTFRVPGEHRARAKELATGTEPLTVFEKFEQVQKEMAAAPMTELETNPRFKPSADMIKSLLASGGAMGMMDEDMPEPLKEEMRRKVAAADEILRGQG